MPLATPRPSRTRRFNLFAESEPLPSESGNGEYWVRHEILVYDWRPSPGDLSRTEIRRLARVCRGGGCPLGGGAAPRYFVRRID